MNSELFVGLCPMRITTYDTDWGDSGAWIIIQVDTGTLDLDTGHQDQLSKDMINRRLRQPPATSSPPH